jgi:DNA-binding MarR family transcriptional regulator
MPSSVTDLDPLSRLSLLVFQAQRALNLEGDQLTSAWGLTSAKWKVLGAVDLAPAPVSAASIGRAMGLTRQAALKQTDQLLAMGLLIQQSNPKDTRAPVYILSPAGQLAYDAISAAWKQRSDLLINGISTSDLHCASLVLTQLLMHMDTSARPSAPD